LNAVQLDVNGNDASAAKREVFASKNRDAALLDAYSQTVTGVVEAVRDADLVVLCVPKEEHEFRPEIVLRHLDAERQNKGRIRLLVVVPTGSAMPATPAPAAFRKRLLVMPCMASLL
jgi:hypothetical protein